jgi:uncharacterized protein YegP (UPF0339 family)
MRKGFGENRFIKVKYYTYSLMVNNMSAAPKFEIYKDAAEKFRFRLKAANGEVIASGEAYESKDGCENGIASVKANAPIAEIVDLTQAQ